MRYFSPGDAGIVVSLAAVAVSAACCAPVGHRKLGIFPSFLSFSLPRGSASSKRNSLQQRAPQGSAAHFRCQTANSFHELPNRSIICCSDFHSRMFNLAGGCNRSVTMAAARCAGSSSGGRIVLENGDGYGGPGLHYFPPKDECLQQEQGGAVSSAAADAAKSQVEKIPPLATLIFMHGLSDSAEGWQDLPLMLNRWMHAQQGGERGNSSQIAARCAVAASASAFLRLILPQAPVRSVQIYGGAPANAWSDVYGLTEKDPEDEAGFEASRQRIDQIIRKEIEEAGVQPGRIVVAGFSQGGAMAYEVALHSKFCLGGVAALSAWLPLLNKFQLSPSCTGGRGTSENAQQQRPCDSGGRVTRVLHVHGDMDEIVSLKYGKGSFDIIRKHYVSRIGEAAADNAMQFLHRPGMGHDADEETLTVFFNFVFTCLDPTKAISVPLEGQQ